jgi:hypothetical protein
MIPLPTANTGEFLRIFQILLHPLIALTRHAPILTAAVITSFITT